jgi:1-acylglycerone phosphate reductase
MTFSHQKTVLITGASADSLGEALAKEFHRRNYKVIVTARSVSRLTTLTNLGMTALELDLKSSTSLHKLASQITELDVLVNNAGANLVMPLADTTPEQFRNQFEVNVFPHFELTNLLLPLLIRSKGVILNHTSQSAYGIKPPSGAYAAAKAALACLTDVQRIELQPFGIRVVELVTGMAASNITRFENPSKLPEGSIYTPVKARLEHAMSAEDAKGKEMSNEVWAKRVVADLLDGGWFGYPKQIWRGTMATTMWWVYYFDVVWKGCWDGLFRLALGLNGLNKIANDQKKRV